MTEPSENRNTNAVLTSMTGWLQLATVIGVIVAAIIINRIIAASVGGDDPTPAAPRTPLVEVILPGPQSETIRISETGTIRTRTNVSVTPQVTGRVIEISPEMAPGGRFKAGDILFVVDPTDFRLAVQQAKADLQTARSNLQLAQAEGETARREWRLLNGDEPIPPLAAREPQIAQAKASVAAAEARLATAQVDLERTQFHFPFDGRILTTSVEVGQTLSRGQPYGTAYPYKSLEAFVALDPSALASLEPVIGRRARVTASTAPGTGAVPATVLRVDAELSQRTRLAGLALGFDSPAPFLPGVFVEAEIEGDTLDNIFSLPVEAVAAGDTVWVVSGGALRAVQPIIIARLEDRVITERFDTAEGVVVTLPAGARDGLEVSVRQVTPDDGE